MTKDLNLLVGITSYGDFAYTARAIRSCLETTPNAYVLVVDDASKAWPRHGLPPEFADFHGDVDPAKCGKHHGRVGFARFDENYGLTRSMNMVVNMAQSTGATYCVVANNDVVFTKGWWDGLEAGLAAGYDLVSPVSNAPGPTAKGLQEVDNYLLEPMNLTDDQAYLDSIADELRKHHAGKQVEARVNGFLLAAKTGDFVANAFAAGETFKLEVTHNSRGQKNPTPRATLMEDHYQHRLYDRGGKAAVCPSSFVFHYRSVHRGDRHKQGRWFRPEPGK